VDPVLTPDEVARVLRRASEMAGTGDDPEVRGLPASAVVAAAAEVGISADAVHRAIALERLGDVPAGARGDSLVGPRTLVVERRLAMPVAETMARLDDWLVQGHHLRREHWASRDAEWGRRDGLVAAGSRATRHALGEGRLGEIRSIRASAREDGQGTLLRVHIDRAAARSGYVASGAGVAAAGAATGAVLAVVVFPAFVLIAPAAVAGGAGIARAGRQQSDKLERETQRLLDAIAGRMTPTTLGDELRRRVRRRR
jgi:hypothetical protein